MRESWVCLCTTGAASAVYGKIWGSKTWYPEEEEDWEANKIDHRNITLETLRCPAFQFWDSEFVIPDDAANIYTPCVLTIATG